jgi:hypothetical protein
MAPQRREIEVILSPTSEEVGSFIIWSDEGPMEASEASRDEGYAR